MHKCFFIYMRHATAILAATALIAISYVDNIVSAEEAAPAPSAQIRPLTESNVTEAWQKVISAAAAINQRFAIDPANADGWKKYLDWDQFNGELSKPKPDMKILLKTYELLAAGHEGLELRHFYDLRTALHTYLTIVSAMGNADFNAVVEKRLAELADARKAPASAETQQVIAEQLAWLESLHQAGDVVQSVRSQYNQPNFYLSVNGNLLAAGVNKPVDEVAPIKDCILGTTINGCGHTVGSTTLVLCPDPNHCTMAIMMQGVNSSANTGLHSPVTIKSTGTTTLYATKQVWIDASGVHLGAVAACANARSAIQAICDEKGRQMVTNIASRRAEKQMPEAESIASAHATDRLRKQFDAQATPRLVELSQRLDHDVQAPLVDQGIFPSTISYTTDTSAIHITGVQAVATQLGAASAPPALTGSADMTAVIHESAVNNMLDRFLSGLRLTDAMVQKLSAKFPRAQEKIKDNNDKDTDKESAEVDFPGETPPQIGREIGPRIPPVTVSFVDNGFSITLRAKGFLVQSNALVDPKQPGMNVAANYTFEKTAQGYKAVRQGEINVYEFGKKPDSPRDFRQIRVGTVMKRKFEKIFTKEIRLDGFTPQGQLASIGKLVPVEIVAKPGWLAIGWRRE